MKNWKTTLSGVSLIISGIALFFNDQAKIAEAFAMVMAGVGLVTAKDNNVTGGKIKQ